jgi:HAD superfamily hydrolase (TIGR01549 family)
MEKMIKAVLFDALQTLIDLDPSFPGAFARVCSDFGYNISEEDVARVMPHVDDLEMKRLSDEDNLRVTNEFLEERWLTMNELIFSRVGIEGNVREMAVEMENRFEHGSFTKIFPDTIPVLEGLRDRGMRLGIVSNGTASIMNCLKYHGIDSYVDFILVSGLVGWEKPARRIFEIALEKAGVKPCEAVFVGDHYFCDIQGSRSMGIRPIMITRKEIPPGIDCEVITNLAKVLELV